MGAVSERLAGKARALGLRDAEDENGVGVEVVDNGAARVFTLRDARGWHRNPLDLEGFLGVENEVTLLDRTGNGGRGIGPVDAE